MFRKVGKKEGVGSITEAFKLIKSSLPLNRERRGIYLLSGTIRGWQPTLSVWSQEKALRTGSRESFTEMRWV